MVFFRTHKVLKITLIAVFLLCLLLSDLFMIVEEESDAMEPTIPAGSIVIARRVNLFTKIRRGQIIIFDQEGTTGHVEQYIRRVYALPNDITEYTDKWFAISGKQIDLTTFLEPLPEPYYMYAQIMGEDQYFVMGDNRLNSTDSRNWPYRRFVERKNIKAIAIAVFSTEGGPHLVRLQIPEAFSVVE